MADEDYFAASRIRRSPTGRVPQWVLDEAMGRPVEPVPFRAPTTTRGPTARPRRLSLRSVAIVVGVASACALAYAIRGPMSLTSTGPVLATSSTKSAPPVGLEEARRPLGHAPSAPAFAEGSSYRFTRHQEDGTTPVAWSPCRPIHYVVWSANQPPMGASLIAAAVAEVSSATGLRFVDDGPTVEGPGEERNAYQPERYGRRWAPVLVAWATPAEVPDFGVDIAGEAGPLGLATPSGDRTYVSGTVFLDPAKVSRVAAEQGSAAAQVIVMHELGHLVGLQHVDDPTQVMYPRSGSVTTFGAGDLAGLAQLGRGSCQPDI